MKNIEHLLVENEVQSRSHRVEDDPEVVGEGVVEGLVVERKAFLDDPTDQNKQLVAVHDCKLNCQWPLK